MSADENLNEFLKNGAFLVDVRTPGEFKSGSVKGAVNIPLAELQQELKRFKGKKNIVLFCRSGSRSGYAKRILIQNGITDVANGGSVGNVKKELNKI